MAWHGSLLLCDKNGDGAEKRSLRIFGAHVISSTTIYGILR